MAKVTALTPDLMNPPESAPAISPRAAINPTSEPKKAEKQTPLQIRIPANEAKAIKRAALEADQTISEFMLACFHAYMKQAEKSTRAGGAQNPLGPT